MHFNQETKTVLKSISSISEQIFITSGVIGVTDPEKIIGVYYSWEQEVPEPFGIPDIANFLSVLDMYQNPSIVKENNYVIVSEGKKKNKCVCMAEAAIVKPKPIQEFIDGVIKKRTPESTFTLTKELFMDLKKNISILKNTHVKFEGNIITTVDKRVNSITNSENSFSTEVDGLQSTPKVIKSEYFSTMVLDEYAVSIYDSFIWLESKNFKLKYMIKLIAI